MKTCPLPHRRKGFTVVEILIVITVIGILVGMLVPAVMSGLTRANEASIEIEMGQIGTSIEKFKTKYGFYPPNFAYEFSTDPETAANQMLTFLNVIAPNHAEGSGVFPNRNVDTWWANVGQDIQNEPGADLVFWLSGLAINKQYPLTNNGVALAAHDYSGDGIDRQVFFEFVSDRLHMHGLFADYIQARGPEVSYRYIDNNNYGSIGGTPYAYHNGVEFFNPRSFQLLSYGMDGQPGPNAWNLPMTGPDVIYAMDNIVNFAVGGGPGRLETIALP